MSDIKQYEPLWGSWYIDSQLGEGSFGKVYKVHKEEFGKVYYAAVKMISIPQSEAELEQARSEGLDDASARSYFQTFVTDIIQEIDLMSAFKGNTNIVSLEDHEVVEKKSSIGWDILIRMELLTTLSAYMNEKPLMTEDIVQVGMDIARALELCAMKKTIHRDIKPDNIFVSQYGDYKLGDFGIARQIERTMSGLSKKGTYTYMAPEVFKGEEYGPSVDLYSLGIVMYRYLNKNRTPFLPPFPDPITPRDRDEALRRRMSGERLPDIPDIDPELNDLVLKACAYNREDRFKDATEFRTALEKFAGSTPRPPAQEVKREPVKAGVKKPRSMRVENDEKTAGVFALRRNEPEFEEVAKAPEVPAKITNIFANIGAICAGILTLLCIFSGNRGDIVVSMPLYALCVAMCVINFKQAALNATLIIWLVCYLAFSALMNFGAFDYPLLALLLGLLSVEVMRSSVRNYKLILSVILSLCAIVSSVLIFRSMGASDSAAFRAYTAASCGIPFLMFFTAGLVVLPKRGDGRIIAGLLAMQFFSLMTFLFLVFGRGSGIGANILFHVADASFVGFSPERFSWWRYARFLGLVLQMLMAECMICIAAARMTPPEFLGLMANKKKTFIIFAVCLAIIAAGIFVVTFI